jgi:hypothetical protein
MVKFALLMLALVLGAAETANAGQFLNLSTRGYVDGSGKKLYAGLVIRGTSPKEVVVKAIGPSLSVPSPLPDPKLTVYDSDRDPISSNDDWVMHPTATLVEASGFAPSHDSEPAVALTLPPGAYTVVVESADGGAGDSIVSVNDVSLTAEDPYAPSDLEGMWDVFMKTTYDPDGECTDAEGLLSVEWSFNYYTAVGFGTRKSEAAETFEIIGVVESGLFDAAAAYPGYPPFANAFGSFVGDIGSGVWNDTTAGCSGWWVAYKEL